MSEFGFKRLTVENWLTVDPAWNGVVMSDSLPNPSQAWVHDLVEVQLDDGVPLAVRKLFETAKSALAYSLMFYPLLTLATEQLYRVVDAATVAKCSALGNSSGSFRARVEWLTKQGVIDLTDQQSWTTMVHLRNDSSHPLDQKIYAPAMTLHMLDATAEMINQLFA